jgi:sec-independent protein translocase protein TatC
MATAIRPIGHEDRLSLVDHLDELRTRLIISGVALVLAFGLCLWQNHALLHVINRPLEAQTQKQVSKGEGPLGQTALAQQGVLRLARENEAILRTLAAPGSGLSKGTQVALQAQIAHLRADVARIPRVPTGNRAVTLGLGEPFTTTITVSLLFALILALPVILFELYGFVLPAFKPNERRVVGPLLAAVPFLFASGVLFGYYVVLPAAVHFLQNFNSSEFNVLVQAGPYYQFVGTVLLAMGVLFQIPVAILGATRAQIVTPTQLRRGRRYAVVACASLAAFLPGDVMTLILETIPLYVLYELSIVIAVFVHRRQAATAERQQQAATAQRSSAGGDGEQDTQSVSSIIDYVDRDLSG